MINVIVAQNKVRNDIYNILSTLFPKVKHADDVAIESTIEYHHIIAFGFDTVENHWGSFEYSLNLKIPVDYTNEMLEEIVLKKLIEVLDDGI